MKAVSLKTIGFQWLKKTIKLLQEFAVSLAEVITDGSLGPQKKIKRSHLRITVDLGSIKGSNLLHRLSEFNWRHSRGTTFSVAVSIASILSQVTEGNPSNVDGWICPSVSTGSLAVTASMDAAKNK